jgi:thiol-disulfide isomerase/thioredoxin
MLKSVVAKTVSAWHKQLMHRTAFLLCGLVMVRACLSAAETKLPELQVGQRVFRNIVILGVDATDLYFRYDGGIRNAKLRDLQPELQKMFGYDPVRAAEIEQRRIDEERQFAESVVRTLQAEALARLRGPETVEEETLADALTENSHLNKPMPELAVEKWLTEKPSGTNKLMIVYFLKTTSAPCKHYTTQFNEWQKKYAEQLVVVGLSPESQLGKPAESEIGFALGLDPENRIAKKVGVSNVPQIFLVDPNGIVRYCGHPAAVTEKTLKHMFEMFGLHFEEKAPSTATAPAKGS